MTETDDLFGLDMAVVVIGARTGEAAIFPTL
jgi:hypothetical protein